MTTFSAVFTGVNTENSASYEFEADADLFEQTPFEVLTTAIELVEKSAFHDHHDYELHAVSRNVKRDAVTGIGYLISGHGEIPFTIRVARA